MRNLLRSFFQAGPSSPDQVFAQALRERGARLVELRKLALGALYLRNKLEASVFEQRALVARLHDQARRLARGGNDQGALAQLDLVERERQNLSALEGELRYVRAEALRSKKELEQQQRGLEALERERHRSRAVLQRAERTPHPPEDRLEQARAIVERARAESDLDLVMDQDNLLSETSISARIELQRLKKSPTRA